MKSDGQGYELGDLVKRIRKSEKLSIVDLARRTGLSQSFISQLERGLTNPSIGSLRIIADALRCPLGIFFQDPKRDEGPVVRKAERKILFNTDSKITYELMSDNPAHTIQLLVTVLEPQASSVEKARTHRGDEAGLVIQGKGSFQLGEDYYELEEGDAIFINEGIPHGITNTGDLPLIVMSAISPPGF